MNKSGQFYLPNVLDYSEYDFRNNQAQEALEDAFWESNYSAFSHEDYVAIKKNSLQGDYFSKPNSLYNLGSRTSDKKSFILDVPAPFICTSFAIANDLQNSYALPFENTTKLILGTDLVNHSFRFIEHIYSVMFKATFTKKALFYANLVGKGYYFNPYELAYGSRSSNIMNVLGSTLFYQKGISNIRVSNIDSASNLSGLNWDNFNFNGMGSDKYQWFNAI
jgi:hypothetical protein